MRRPMKGQASPAEGGTAELALPGMALANCPATVPTLRCSLLRASVALGILQAANFDCSTAFSAHSAACSMSEQPMRILGQVHVERVDFVEPRVPQEEWASIRGHSVVSPEAASMQAASLL